MADQLHYKLKQQIEYIGECNSLWRTDRSFFVELCKILQTYKQCKQKYIIDIQFIKQAGTRNRQHYALFVLFQNEQSEYISLANCVQTYCDQQTRKQQRIGTRQPCVSPIQTHNPLIQLQTNNIEHIRHNSVVKSEFADKMIDIKRVQSYYDSSDSFRSNSVTQLIATSDCIINQPLYSSSDKKSIDIAQHTQNPTESRSKQKKVTASQQLCQSMREAVYPEVKVFRLKKRQMCVICNTTDHDQLQVDHIIRFETLKSEFIHQKGFYPSQFEINVNGRYEFMEQDLSFKTEWQSYHAHTAKLQMLCRQCNLFKEKIHNQKRQSAY